MTLDTLQQLVRILLLAGGGALLGDGIADSAEYQAAIGGALNVIAFVWWAFWERKQVTEKRIG